MKKVLIITYYWPPSGGAGVQRWLKFSKYLPEFDWNPIVLTVDENLASYAQLDPSLLKEISPNLRIYKTKTFEPYNFYKKISNKKEIPYGGFSNQKKITLFEKFSRLIRGNLFLPDPRRGWNRYAIKKALELIKREQIEVIITSGPPHSSHLIGNRIKNITGIKWIADFRDPWTDIFYYKELYHSRLATWIDRHLEKKILSNADQVITVSEEIRKLFRKKIQHSQDKIAVIPNGYDEADFEKGIAVSNEKFTITYCGTISTGYKIGNFVDAIFQLPELVKNQMTIRFVGNVPDEILQLFERKKLRAMIDVMGYLPHEQAVGQMKGASLLLMAIPDSPDNKGVVTGKFFEYLAANRPILAIGPLGGDVDLLIKKCTAGKIFSYEAKEEMKQFILERFEMDQKKMNNGNTTGTEKYTRRNLTRELVSYL